jgi:hypothetical protein
MSMRRVVSGPRAGSGSPRLLPSCVVLSLWFGAIASAQEGAPAVPPATSPPVATPAAPTFGKIVVDSTSLRCWPGAVATPPVFEDTVTKDQIVAVGRSENGFRAIVVPLGPIGYVSRKFTTTAADGRVTTKGSKVSFRYRPRSAGEPPVTQLAENTELFVLGEQDEWFRVRAAGVDAWLPEAEVQLLDAADPTAAAAYADWGTRQRAEVQARLDQIAAQIARSKQDEVDVQAVRTLQDRYTLELNKPAGEQQMQPLDRELEQLLSGFAADSAGRPAVASLQERIKNQRWVAEATAAVQSSPPPVIVDQKPIVRDNLSRFESIGWLRYERRLAGPGVYYMEKGGQRQHVLTCNTGRYDLALFVGREVGVIGPRRQPATESLSVLDVERLEVLGTLVK